MIITESKLNDMHNVLIIANPAAGKRAVETQLGNIMKVFMDLGFNVSAMLTSRCGEACEIAKLHAAEYDLVICAGGDGTLNETVNGIVAAGVKKPLAYLPCGSTNDFASACGIPKNILKAAERAASGDTVMLNVGSFGERCFVGTAFFGAFSWLGYTTDQAKKNRLGFSAYVVDGLKEIKRNQPHRLRLSANGRIYEDEYIFGAVSNLHTLCGVIKLPCAHSELAERGVFNVLLIKAPKTTANFNDILHGITTGSFEGDMFDYFQAMEIAVDNEKGLIWNIDGESSGELDSFIIRCNKGALMFRGAKI